MLGLVVVECDGDARAIATQEPEQPTPEMIKQAKQSGSSSLNGGHVE
jgi:hypothetical protein